MDEQIIGGLGDDVPYAGAAQVVVVGAGVVDGGSDGVVDGGRRDLQTRPAAMWMRSHHKLVNGIDSGVKVLSASTVEPGLYDLFGIVNQKYAPKKKKRPLKYRTSRVHLKKTGNMDSTQPMDVLFEMEHDFAPPVLDDKRASRSSGAASETDDSDGESHKSSDSEEDGIGFFSINEAAGDDEDIFNSEYPHDVGDFASDFAGGDHAAAAKSSDDDIFSM